MTYSSHHIAVTNGDSVNRWLETAQANLQKALRDADWMEQRFGPYDPGRGPVPPAKAALLRAIEAYQEWQCIKAQLANA